MNLSVQHCQNISCKGKFGKMLLRPENKLLLKDMKANTHPQFKKSIINNFKTQQIQSFDISIFNVFRNIALDIKKLFLK